MRKVWIGLGVLVLFLVLAVALGYIRVSDAYEDKGGYLWTQICLDFSNSSYCIDIPRALGDFLGASGFSHSNSSIHFLTSASPESPEMVTTSYGATLPKPVADEFEASSASDYARLSSYPVTLSRCVSSKFTRYQVSERGKYTGLDTYFTEDGTILGTNSWGEGGPEKTEVDFSPLEYTCSVLQKSK